MKVALTGNRLDVIFLTDYFKQYGIKSVIINRKNPWDVLTKILSSNIIHIISIKSNGYEGVIWILLFSILRLFNKRIVLHWQGSDVLELTPKYAFFLSRLVDAHLSYAPWLSDELEILGIKSIYLPIPPPLPLNESEIPLPDKFTILTYLGGSKKLKDKFYGSEIVIKLIHSLPGARFIIVGKLENESTILLPNVQYLGNIPYEEMENVYSQSTVLLRITGHDGLAFMVLESLVRGRYVIWSKSFPHCWYAEDYSRALLGIEEILKLKTLNIEGMKYAKNNFSSKKVVEDLLKVYKNHRRD